MKSYIRYLYAILAIPIVILTRYALLPLTGHGTPFITLFPATVIIALLGGMGPAILTGVIGVLVSDFFFIPPLHTLDLSIEFWTRCAVVVLTSTFVGYVGKVLREARSSAEKQALELHNSREDLKRAQTVALTGSWRLDIRRNELQWSDEAYRIFGVPQGTPMTYESFLSYIHPDDREFVDEKWKAALKEGKYDIEHRITVDGRIKWVRERAELEFDKAGTLIGGFGTVTDVTERKQREQQLHQLNRTLRALSKSTQAIMRAQDEQQYLQQVCDIIVNDCGHAMVWIGFAENDEAKSVRPVAYSGFEKGYLETLKITWSDTERGRGPTGTAIRTGQVSFCKNIPTNPAFEPWRKEAIKRGYASSISLPLLSGDKAFGALTIYSKDPDPFSENEVNLLTELTSDLSFGITSIRLRKARDEAEKELKKSRDELEIRVDERTAELKKTNESLRLEQARLDALLHLSRMSEEPLDKLTGFTLEQAIALTRSKIGFVGFISDDEKTYTLHSVSKDVVKECNVEGDPAHWPVDDAGIWADAIREHRTLIVNDYSKPHPRKKGIPAGHVGIERFMVVPLLENNKVVTIAGVGNKNSDYDASDERQVSLLLSGMWGSVQKTRSRESILAERKRFFDVLETLPVYVCLLTPDYYMPFANKVFREWFGYYPDKKCYEFLFNRTEPCENCETYKVLETNKPQRWEWTGPNGRNYDIFDFPFKDTDGSRLILEMGIDITERKQAQDALRATSLYARGLLEASLDPLVTISKEGKITDVNNATELVTGLPRERLIGSNFSDYFTDPQKANEGYKKVLSEGSVRDYPLTIRRSSGGTTDVLYNATLYRNEAGEVQGVFAAARDITEKKITEAELEKYRLHLEDLVRQRTEELARSNKDLEQFAYVASHDLQEPLRAVSGFVSLLQHHLENALDEKTREYMDFTVDGVARMQSLINGLLEYSRIDTRGKPPEKTDSKKSLDEALLDLQASIKETGAKITGDNLPTVNIDPLQLKQLFQNLISNAIKFRGEQPPEIQVSAERENSEWRFAIKDNGIGIEPQYSERIFLIFQRLHTRKKYPGTGIGLPLCKKIVERHGGKIWVESEPGRGSTFYFTVPDKEGVNQ